MANSTGTPVTVIGLGLMGRALAETLIKAGHPTTVWNRTPGKADELVASGATKAETVAEAVRASNLVIVCVLDYQAVQDVIDAAGGELRDRVVVNLTNGRPSEAREMAEVVTGHGAQYLDGGIMAVPPMIGNPGALILYSGSEEAFKQHQTALEPLAATAYVGSDPGFASLHDLALLGGMYGLFAGFFHAVAMVRTENIPAAQFTELLVPWLNAMAGLLPEFAADIDATRYATEVSNLDVNKGGLGNILRASREQGIEPDLLAPLQEMIEKRVAAGHGAEGLPGLIEEIRKVAS